ncbi:phage tail tape measure protein [Massilioclostridium coli]|uniref:phage tail tape measure protein n=1 Tax=Massilioclostridium coli TaxID=1870991 RepID=UPI00085C3197|nr:phage tail tape measure protein [Massilioclostridium coli]
MAGKGIIGFGLAIDGEKEYQQSLKNITQNQKVLNSEVEKTQAVYKNQKESIESVSAQYQLYGKKLDNLREKESLQQSVLEKVTKAYQDSGKKVESLKTQLSSAEKALDQMKNSSNATAEEIKAQEKAVKDLETQLKTAERQYGAAERATGTWQIALNKTKTEIANTENSLKDLGTQLSTKKSSLSQFGEAADDAATKLGKVSEKADKIGNVLTVGVTVPVTAAAGAMVGAMDQVDEGLDTVITKTGATGTAAQELDAVYREVASNIPAEFGDIGAAVGEINTRLGFTGDKLKVASEDFLKFAKVNGTDVNTSVQLVTRAMGDAGIESNNYKSVLDMLTVAAQKSGISIDSLTTNLAKYGAPMRALGIDTQTAIAMFAGWEKAGVNTEIAFSGMKQAISAWSAEGKDATKEFSKTMDAIKSASDISKATAIAIEAFGKKAGPDLADAIKGGRFEVDEYIQALQSAGGTVDNTYGAIVDEVDDSQLAMQRLKLAMHDTGETIAKSVGPVLLDLVENIEDVFEWFGNLDKGTQQTILKFIAFAAAAGPVTKVIGGIAGGTKTAVSGLGNLAKALSGQVAAKTAATALGSVATNATAAGTATAAAGSAAAGAAVTLGTVAAVAGGVAAAGLLTYAVASQTAADESFQVYWAIQQSKTALEESKQAHAENMEAIDNETDSNQDLIDKLYELNDKQTLTNGEMETMKGIVDQLNENLPGLNLLIDEQSGKLNASKESVEAYNDAYRTKLYLETQGEDMSKVVKDQMKAQEDLNAALDDYNTKKVEYDELNAGMIAKEQGDDATYQQYINTYGGGNEQIYWDKWNTARGRLETATNNVNTAQAVVDGFEQTINEMSNAYAATEKLAEKGINMSAKYIESLSQQTPEVVDETIGLLDKLKNGTKLNFEEIGKIFSNAGMELPDNFNEKLMFKSPEMQLKVIQLLSEFMGAADSKKPELVAQMAMMGFSVDDALSNGLKSNIQVVRDGAAQTITDLKDAAGNRITNITPEFAQMLADLGIIGVDEMDRVVSQSQLTAPGMKSLDAQTWVQQNWPLLQGEADKNPITVPAKVKIKVDKGWQGPVQQGVEIEYNADGGIINKQTLSWLAEGDKPEAVIPLDPSKRARALSLYQKTGAALGVPSAAIAPQSNDGTLIDYNKMARCIVSALQKSPVQVNTNFEVKQGDVLLSNEKAGKALAPVISRIQARNARL